MVLAGTNNRVEFNGDGVTVSFGFTFDILEQADLMVINTLLVPTVQVLGVDYTLTGPFPGPGNVVFTTAPASGTKNVIIIRDPAPTQTVDLVIGDEFPPDTVEEKMVDRVVMLIQKDRESLGRTLKVSEESIFKDLDVPDPVAGKLLGWKAGLDGLENFDAATLSATVIPTAFMSTMITTDTTAGEVLSRIKGVDQNLSQITATDTGAADAHAIALTPTLTAYVQNQAFTFEAANSNTGVTTLNVDGLGAKNIKKNIVDDLVAGDIVVGQIIVVVYDGTNFQLFAAAGTSTSSAEAGEIKATVRTTAPGGWVLCDGDLLNCTTFQTLFTVMVSNIADWGRGAAHSTFTVTTGNDELISAAHGFVVDDVIHVANSGGALPAGLATEVLYFVKTVPTAGTLTVSLTKGGATVDITTVGTGTHSIYDEFEVPDFRGRTPLGADNMGGTPANRVTASQADNLGQGSGIEIIPNHVHPGSTAHTATNDEGDIAGIGIHGWSSAQTFGHDNVGNPTTSLSTLSPYQTVNYIIKT